MSIPLPSAERKRLQREKDEQFLQKYSDPDYDEHLWLEEIEGDSALAWVRTRNQETEERLGHVQSTEAYGRILEILNSQHKIPYVRRIGSLLYNFWTDADHEKGIWRRTTIESYSTEAPEWETVLDLDLLSSEEGESWVWHGSDVLDLGPNTEWDRVLLTLSPGGSDASTVREFSLKSKSFIKPEDGGFVIPTAKSSVGWRGPDELLVGTDTGPDSMTDSGYPRQVLSWRRGTALSEAALIWDNALKEDISAGQYLYYDRGVWHEFRYRSMTFYTTEQWYRSVDPSKTADTEQVPFVKIPVPDDASVSTFGKTAMIRLRSEWTPMSDGQRYPGGALLSCPMSSLMDADFTRISILFEPRIGSHGHPSTSLESWCGTQNFLILVELQNVKTTLRMLRYNNGNFTPMEIAGDAVPVGCSVNLSSVDSDSSDEVWVTRDGYLEPDTMYLGTASNGLSNLKLLKSKPSMFNADDLCVEQHMAVSADGCEVPYFVMRKKDMVLNGSHPTLLDGYGGFEISMTPGYSAGVGAAWLEKGGIKVIANIRGGGEFGPSWHQAALKEHRHKAYEDFEAVARDLIARKYTDPARLACIGGSNGGLLVGNMLTRQGAALFGAVVCQVPLLDMKRYHKLLAGASWMAEFGDPDKPEEWSYLQHHSPYQRLSQICLAEGSTWKCPSVLFVTSTKDDRVHPGHARKMARALLDVPSAANGVLYWENIEGGHGGAADNKQRAYMWALAYNYLWKTIGGGGLMDKYSSL